MNQNNSMVVDEDMTINNQVVNKLCEFGGHLKQTIPSEATIQVDKICHRGKHLVERVTTNPDECKGVESSDSKRTAQ